MIRIANKHPRIAADQAIMMGKACIAGTRVPVYLVLQYLGAGQTSAEILEAFPRLTHDDIAAALSFAADVVNDEPVVLADAADGPHALADA